MDPIKSIQKRKLRRLEISSPLERLQAKFQSKNQPRNSQTTNHKASIRSILIKLQTKEVAVVRALKVTQVAVARRL